MSTRTVLFIAALAGTAGAAAQSAQPAQLQLPGSTTAAPTAATTPAAVLNAAQAPKSAQPASSGAPTGAATPANLVAAANAAAPAGSGAGLVLPSDPTQQGGRQAAAQQPAAGVSTQPAAQAPAQGAQTVYVERKPAETGTAPKPAAPRRSTRRQAEPEKYAGLNVTKPALEALQRSDSWVNNSTASVSAGADGRVVFLFGETMPTVVCAPLRMCDIELQPGEKVLGKPFVGDPRFIIEPGFSGSGDNLTVHVIVKPREKGLDTTLNIGTDRRMYRVRLVSDDTNYVSYVSWDYPEDQAKAWDAALSMQVKKESAVVADMPAITASDLDFNYAVTVKKGHPSFVPLRVFTENGHTYIQMPADVTETELPALLAQSADGDDELVNPVFKAGYFIVDRKIKRAILVSGVGGKAESVEIKYCVRRGLFGGCKDK